METKDFIGEERERMLDQAYEKMKIKRKQIGREELEKEIIDYLSKKQPCSLATCSRDGVPRISVVGYINEGLTIYIFSEGGGKFKNLSENNRVAIGIGTGAKALRTRGVNISGIGEVFTDDTPEFKHGINVFQPVLQDMQEAAGGVPLEFPKGLLKMIRVTPTRIVYHHTVKGIKHALWEAL